MKVKRAQSGPICDGKSSSRRSGVAVDDLSVRRHVFVCRSCGKREEDLKQEAAFGDASVGQVRSRP